MIVRNPTKEDISIQIQGRLYTVKAGGELPGISENHARHWQRIHSFIHVSEEIQEVLEEVLEKGPEKSKTEVKKEDSKKSKDKLQPESKKAKSKK